MKYDEIVELARLFQMNSKESRQILNMTISGLDNDGLIDTMETCREILFENSGDEELTLTVIHFMELIQAEQSTRITQNLFSKVGKFFKKRS